MKTNVAVTGFYGTGSSAVLDYLREFDDVGFVPENISGYEHVALYEPGGLFDLGAVLRFSNTLYNSDVAMGRFVESMYRLNDTDFGWYGSYKKQFDDEFKKIVDEFVCSISIEREYKGTSHAVGVRFSPIKAALQIAANIVFKRKISKLGRKYIYDKYQPYIALPSDDEFCAAARKFTTSYMDLFETSKNVRVFDHLVWPQNTKFIQDYFDQNFKVIIVTRDARDVFLLNKYFWHKPPRVLTKPYFPTEVKDFCKVWKHNIEGFSQSENVLVINFEDLIYNTEATEEKIRSFIGLKDEHHLINTHFFDPAKSIENTQIFMVNNEIWKKEAEEIKKLIPGACYEFPYNRVCDSTKWFDTDGVDIKTKKKIDRCD